MSLANPYIQTLKELIAVEEKRVLVQNELAALDERISSLRGSLQTGSPVTSSLAKAKMPAASKSTTAPVKLAGHGTYRENIMAALEAAGDVGVWVKDLALSLKTKPVNIHSWFHSNLKRIPSIKKIKGGHYKIASGAKGAAPSALPVFAPKVGRPARGKRGGTKRGALSASIMAYLQAAGAGGIKISDLAGKLGAKYKNVYIWFATTGKKHGGIKRIAPATYSLKS